MALPVYTIASDGSGVGTEVRGPDGQIVAVLHRLQYDIDATGTGVLTLRLRAGLTGSIGAEVRLVQAADADGEE